MKRKLASIQRILNLTQIESADKIEVATVLGWSVVVKKGEFKIGDLVIYFEIDSLLPIIPEFEFLRKGSHVRTILVNGAEIKGYRLKTVRLRGQISQGLVMPLTFKGNCFEPNEGMDISEHLGIYKYDPPNPACLRGVVRCAFPSGIPKTDEVRIQAYPELLRISHMHLKHHLFLCS